MVATHFSSIDGNGTQECQQDNLWTICVGVDTQNGCDTLLGEAFCHDQSCSFPCVVVVVVGTVVAGCGCIVCAYCMHVCCCGSAAGAALSTREEPKPKKKKKTDKQKVGVLCTVTDNSWAFDRDVMGSDHECARRAKWRWQKTNHPTGNASFVLRFGKKKESMTPTGFEPAPTKTRA